MKTEEDTTTDIAPPLEAWQEALDELSHGDLGAVEDRAWVIAGFGPLPAGEDEPEDFRVGGESEAEARRAAMIGARAWDAYRRTFGRPALFFDYEDRDEGSEDDEDHRWSVCVYGPRELTRAEWTFVERAVGSFESSLLFREPTS